MSNHPFSAAYVATGETLKARILALIPANPQILEFGSAWDLFDVPGFTCDDLQPSLAQAGWALAAAKSEYRKTCPQPESDPR